MNKKNLTARQAVENLETYVSSGSSESGFSHYSSNFSLADSLSSGSTSSGSKNSLDSDGPSPAQRPRQYTAQTLTWHKRDCSPTIHSFTGSPGVKANIDRNTSALDIFSEFFTPTLMDIVITETNKFADTRYSLGYARQTHAAPWKEVNLNEMKAFFSLCLLMGVVKKSQLKMYWSRDPMLETPFFTTIMPRDRFMQILSNLHFVDNSQQAHQTDRLFKIRPVIDAIITNFKTVFIPYQNVSTDESLLKFHGRLRFRQFNPSKRARFGIKVYKVCQSSGPANGYIWNMKVYTGQDSDPNSGNAASTKVVIDLNQDLLGKGYNIFIDNWYSSPDLFLQLLNSQTNVCGTVRLNRKFMPKDLAKEKVKKGEIAYRSCDEGLLALVWKDKKDVKMLTTMHNASMTNTGKVDRKGNDIVKPSCVLTYNRGMGGVDNSDQRASTYCSVRKQVKWYKKLFFYMFDMCVVNSYLVYKELRNGEACCDLLQFRMMLVNQLIITSTLPEYKRGRPHSLPSPSRLSGRHFLELIPPTDKKAKPQKRCVVCHSHAKRKETIYQCDVCKVPLCAVPCFQAYHTKRNY